MNAVLRALRQEVSERYQLNAIEARQHVDEPNVWVTTPEIYGDVYDAITGA